MHVSVIKHLIKTYTTIIIATTIVIPTIIITTIVITSMSFAMKRSCTQ